jgi:hypothetical protein
MTSVVRRFKIYVMHQGVEISCDLLGQGIHAQLVQMSHLYRLQHSVHIKTTVMFSAIIERRAVDVIEHIL